MKRLRMQRLDGRSDADVMQEAADEIERLAHAAGLAKDGAYWHNIDDQREIAGLRLQLAGYRAFAERAVPAIVAARRDLQVAADEIGVQPPSLPLLAALLDVPDAGVPAMRIHVESGDCWCNPTLDYRDPETGRDHWVHHEPN